MSKGSKQRPIEDQEAFDKNYSKIFRLKEKKYAVCPECGRFAEISPLGVCTNCVEFDKRL